MADLDIVRGKISGPYRKPYKWICEGKADDNECTRALIEAVFKDIKNKGAAPVILAKQMGESLRLSIDSGCKDWVAMSKKLDRLAQQTSCPHYVQELVLHAGKNILHNLRYGKATTNTRNLSEEITEGYMQEAYRSSFNQRIPLISNHYKGVDNDTIMERVKAVSSEVDSEIKKWAKQANADGDVSKLRLPQRQKLKEIDLEEDLL
ncbi:MAG: hypothetical protein AAGJ08_29660 [Cyanobacteria bacterium P01_H01_bin.35]